MSNNIEQVKHNSPFLDSVFQEIAFLRAEYPNFYNWFYQKVVPGLSNGERKIFVAKSSSSYSKINGILILKDSFDEKKICTLYVEKNSRLNGIGKKFMELAFNELNTDKPLITITENKIKDFLKLLNRFDFTLFEKNPNFYSEGLTEYSYNGHLYLPNEKVIYG